MQYGQAVFESNYLIQDFLRNHSQRTLMQLETRQNSLSHLIKNLGKEFEEEQPLFDSIKSHYDDIELILSKLISLNQEFLSGKSSHLQSELNKRLSNYLLVNSQEMMSDTIFLEALTYQQIQKGFLQKILILILLIMFIMVVALVANTLLIRSIIIHPIEKLSQHIKVIGEGKLEHKVPIDSIDEIGKLAAAFNSMTQKLMDITVSRDELAKEILERKEAEKELAGERHFSQALIDTMQAIIMVLNPDGTIQSYNPYMENLSGYKLEEVQGKDWFETFLPENERQKVRKVFHRAIDDIQTQGYVNPIVTRQGNEVQIEWYDKTIKSNDGSTIGLVSIGLDVTERIRAKEILQRAYDELEYRVQERTLQLSETAEHLEQEIVERKKIEKNLQNAHDELEARVKERTIELQKTHAQLLHAEKMSTIGNLSASIAHEFNNPLQGIMSIIKGVKRRAHLSQDDSELIDLAINECNRMRDLIKSLQDFNRPTAGRKALMNVHSAIESIILLSKKEYKIKGITVEKNYTDNLPEIVAVADQIKQVLLNLLNNAADACAQGGNITIETDLLKDNVVVRIHDTGCGITPENKKHIFEPFFTTKATMKGTGLGLPISYGIIKDHGGKITVDSKPGKGTTFSVILPIKGDSDA